MQIICKSTYKLNKLSLRKYSLFDDQIIYTKQFSQAYKECKSCQPNQKGEYVIVVSELVSVGACQELVF